MAVNHQLEILFRQRFPVYLYPLNRMLLGRNNGLQPQQINRSRDKQANADD